MPRAACRTPEEQRARDVLAARRTATYDHFQRELAAANLPESSSLADLLEHHKVTTASRLTAALQAERPYDPNKLNVWMND
jgi:hypothetical protein